MTVRKVLQKGPADRAGVQAGDYLTEFDGQKVESDAGLLKLAARLTAGKEAKLTVLRGDKRQVITVRAGEGL